MSKYEDDDRGGSGGLRHPLRLPDRYIARGREIGRDYRDRDRDRREEDGGDRDRGRQYSSHRDRGGDRYDDRGDIGGGGHPYSNSSYRGGGGYYHQSGPSLLPTPSSTHHTSIHINPNVFINERIRPAGLIKKYPNYEPFHPPPSENYQYPESMRPKLPPSKRYLSQTCIFVLFYLITWL
jgi:hypothetical protein